MKFTRREKHFLIVFAILLIGIFAFGKQLPDNELLEYLFLLFIVAPLGYYIATDPERIREK